jgi:hypothetical protein
MAEITPQQPGLNPAAPTFVACDVAGDSFANDGRILLHYRNTNAAARNATINSVKACDQGSDHDVLVNVPLTTGERIVGPFSPSRFNDVNGKVQITYDAVTNLTVAVIKV